MNEKVFEIGHYKLVISEENDERFPFYAALFKDRKLWTKFRSVYQITADDAFEFFF